MKETSHLLQAEERQFSCHSTVYARQECHIGMKKVGLGKYAFVKQHLNPKMPFSFLRE